MGPGYRMRMEGRGSCDVHFLTHLIHTLGGDNKTRVGLVMFSGRADRPSWTFHEEQKHSELNKSDGGACCISRVARLFRSEGRSVSSGATCAVDQCDEPRKGLKNRVYGIDF